MTTLPYPKLEIPISQPSAATNDNAFGSPAERFANLGAAVERYAAAAYSDNTRRGYSSDLRSYEAWCRANAIVPFPADEGHVARYLAEMAEGGYGVRTIERAYAALGWGHRERGLHWERRSGVLPRIVAGIRHVHGAPPVQKAPVEDVELRAIFGALGDDLIDIRDRALFAVAWFGCLRRSEVISLDVTGVAWRADGLLLQIRRSKTDQDGNGIEKGAPKQGDPAMCPVRALRAWLDAAEIVDGPVFRRVDRHGYVGGSPLSGQAVADVVKRRVEAVGLEPEHFAGHSLRAGFITTGVRRGKNRDAIKRQSGHKSDRVFDGYVRHASLFIDNAAADLF